mmetsp:Transcript_18158/g.42942  ORF Transcript_18158/g.42942 Transcript_18158/m.42942 type:complete len:208 (+) Transcript_18158:838-1461(+)
MTVPMSVGGQSEPEEVLRITSIHTAIRKVDAHSTSVATRMPKRLVPPNVLSLPSREFLMAIHSFSLVSSITCHPRLPRPAVEGAEELLLQSLPRSMIPTCTAKAVLQYLFGSVVEPLPVSRTSSKQLRRKQDHHHHQQQESHLTFVASLLYFNPQVVDDQAMTLLFLLNGRPPQRITARRGGSSKITEILWGWLMPARSPSSGLIGS